MVSLRREFEIKKIVEEILNKHKIISPPIDLGRILKAENIKYYERDLSHIVDLGSNTEALLLSKDDDRKIVINTAVKERYAGRKRFTLAHELGHFFLHVKKDELYVAARANTILPSSEEEEADKFAAHLLMPNSMVEEIVFKRKDITVTGLAQIFNVSEKAMNRKLVELGML